MFGSQLGSSSQALNLTVITDEALMEEASSGSEAVGGVVLGPLRIILADGREAEVSDLAGREFRAFEEGVRGGFGKGFPRGCGGEGKKGEPCWHSSSLAMFSRSLGMPTKGFKGKFCFTQKNEREETSERKVEW
ncbi:hypothetical protein CK203_089250 [Vitis vinifera]|uniref:Uncharacterized protein n=1 Tax=Vitis vinifera TaxID=29760 RepID=A0A438CZX9_VITVI|nr:hypothetical protein CK203_089250 [Vitis vinifera]